MALSETLKTFRDKGYVDKGAGAPAPETGRIVKLNPEEMTEVTSNDVAPGAEVTLEMNGVLDADGTFHVSQIQYGDTPDESESAPSDVSPEDVMNRMRGQ